VGEYLNPTHQIWGTQEKFSKKLRKRYSLNKTTRKPPEDINLGELFSPVNKPEVNNFPAVVTIWLGLMDDGVGHNEAL